jgi:hypothetical protein
MPLFLLLIDHIVYEYHHLLFLTFESGKVYTVWSFMIYTVHWVLW